MTNKEAVIWLINVTADIGKAKHSDLWHYEQALSEIKEMLESQPERKKGKWVRSFDGNEWYWYCSKCKKEWYEEDLWMGGNDFPNFCPNCGAKMDRGKKDE